MMAVLILAGVEMVMTRMLASIKFRQLRIELSKCLVLDYWVKIFQACVKMRTFPPVNTLLL